MMSDIHHKFSFPIFSKKKDVRYMKNNFFRNYRARALISIKRSFMRNLINNKPGKYWKYGFMGVSFRHGK